MSSSDLSDLFGALSTVFGILDGSSAATGGSSE